jgi:hypothetical protein
MKPSVFPKLFFPGARPGEEEIDVEIPMRAFKRRGQEFLLLPDDAEAAERSLEVYAPQSWFARVAIKLLRKCLRLRIPLPILKRINIKIPEGSLLLEILRTSTPDQRARRNPLPFALLAGNPKEPKRRFVLLSFDEGHLPRIVMKIGVGRYSAELIEREREFIEKHGGRFPCFPVILDSRRDDEFAVFSTKYLRINTLRSTSDAELYHCLSGWIHPAGVPRELGLLPAFDTMQEECGRSRIFKKLFAKVKDAPVFPVIYHGDLVPWNIRAENESDDWVVIDWERGEEKGVPGWDWFHFEVQNSILVNKESPEAIMERISQLQNSELFSKYAERCGITDIKRELFALYLVYFRKVLMHGSGGATLDQLHDIAVADVSF